MTLGGQPGTLIPKADGTVPCSVGSIEEINARAFAPIGCKERRFHAEGTIRTFRRLCHSALTRRNRDGQQSYPAQRRTLPIGNASARSRYDSSQSDRRQRSRCTPGTARVSSVKGDCI